MSKKTKLKYKVKMVEEVTYLCPKCGHDLYNGGFGKWDPAFICSNDKCRFQIFDGELEEYALRGQQ